MKIQKPIRSLAVCLLACSLFGTSAVAKEWTDKSGKFKIQGTMIAVDDKEVVIKLDKRTKDHELLAVSIEDLSPADQEYIASKEAADSLKADGEKHVWELKNGMKIFGRAVRFVRKDVVMQRRRGKLYVNDRPIDNLPEVYQKMVPHVVEYFEKTTFADQRQFDDWAKSQKTKVHTYPCEGVMIEFPNGDEYAIPFFFMTEQTYATLRPAYERWAADAQAQRDAEAKYEQQRQHELYMQSQAASFQQNQQEMLHIARLQLLMNSVAAGATDLWEVYLYPPPGVMGYPISVVVPGRNSDQASFAALQNNPGYQVGPIRKVAGF
jgi:hypothetical protein